MARGLYREEFVDQHEEAFDAVRRWWRAWIEKDVETLNRMVDPEYTEMSETKRLLPMGSKTIGELLEEASRYAKDVFITHWEVFDPVTRLFEHTVVCSYCFRLSGERRGRSFTFEGRATDVLAKKDGQWRLVSHNGSLESRQRFDEG